MRKVMRKSVAAAATLPHRAICRCPPSRLPEGPMAGAGGGAGWRVGQSSRPGGIGPRAASAAETNLFETMSQVTKRQHLLTSPP